MKTILKIFILIIFLSASLTAQVKFGVKCGLNFANVNIDEALGSSTGSRTGLNSGIFFEFYTSKVTSLQFGVDYTQKGCSFENSNMKITHLINYIEIPLLYNIKFTRSKFCPYMSIGFAYGFTTKSVQRQEYNSGEVYDVDTKDLYDGNDFEFIFGLGIQYSISKTFDAFVNCNRSLGTNNTIADLGSESRPISMGSASNNGYQLTAGFKVRL